MTSGININDPTPLYEQIENDIKSKINASILKTGDQVGSQNELSKDYSVSIITVKKALSNLVKEGILFTRVGKGTYVAEKKERKLDLSKHKTIGLVLQDLAIHFFQ